MKRTYVSSNEGASRNGAGTAEATPSAHSYAVGAEQALRAVCVAELDEPELCQLVSDMGQINALADSVTVRAVRRLEALRAGSGRGALVAGAQLSARDAHRLTKTAKQLDQMPNVSERLNAGDLPLDNLLSLGRAAQQCGASAVDSSPELLDRAASHDAGQFAGEALEFARHHDPTRGEELLARQRKNRRGSLGIDAEGMGRITAETDPVSFALLRQAIDERRDHLWRQDGGRDGTPEQVRNNSQRTVDAIFELCTGLDALTHRSLSQPDGADGSHTRASSGARTGAGFSAGSGARTRWARTPIYLVGVGLVDGTNPDDFCELLGTGPVPPSVLDRISPDALVAGIIYDGEGRPLWLGRTIRVGSGDQYLAIAMRDRGCVTCRAPMHHCQLHHIDEFDADDGPTDIDNLAALCHSCHDWLHKTDQRLVRRTDGHGTNIWSAEPRGRGPDPPSGDSGTSFG